jgi:hypothetical protein
MYAKDKCIINNKKLLAILFSGRRRRITKKKPRKKENYKNTSKIAVHYCTGSLMIKPNKALHL